MRLLVASLLALTACGSNSASVPVRLVEARRAGQVILAVVPSRAVRINARVPPAIELNGGSVIRLARGRVSSDSTYFIDPPWEFHSGLRGMGGALRVSYCRLDETLCRSTVLPVRLP